jgi:transcriptional regulator with XRE-family HTH domain
VGDYFRERLRAERERQGLTLAQLARALSAKDIHVYTTTIAKIEAGERAVRVDELVAIAGILDVPVDSLLGTQSRLDDKVAQVLRGCQDVAHQALREARVHMVRIGGQLNDLLTIAEDMEAGSPQRQRLLPVIDEAQRVMHGFRQATDASAKLVALTAPMLVMEDSNDDT